MKRSRALFAVAPVALLAALLTACAGGADASGCLPSGSASEAVEIDGGFGGEVELVSGAPLEAEALQRTVLISGEGDELEPEDTVRTRFSIINATDGSLLSSEMIDLTFAEGKVQPWAQQVLACSSIGDRVAAVAPVADVVGANNAAQFGLEEGDSIVMVLDLIELKRTAPECDALEPRDAVYPEVDLGDGTGEPRITIPDCMQPPAELEVEVLEEGDGPVVVEGDAVMTNYVGVDWNGAVWFDGTWNDTGVEFATTQGQLIEGVRQALIGKNIGSTVLVTVPPELGYFDGITRTFVLHLVGKA